GRCSCTRIGTCPPTSSVAGVSESHAPGLRGQRWRPSFDEGAWHLGSVTRGNETAFPVVPAQIEGDDEEQPPGQQLTGSKSSRSRSPMRSAIGQTTNEIRVTLVPPSVVFSTASDGRGSPSPLARGPAACSSRGQAACRRAGARRVPLVRSRRRVGPRGLLGRNDRGGSRIRPGGRLR